MRRHTTLLAAGLAALFIAGCGGETFTPTRPVVYKGDLTYQTDLQYYVYTPPGYNEQVDYPVLYLLHGYGMDETGFAVTFSAPDAADNLLHDGLMEPMVIVMPRSTNDFGGTFYTNSPHPAVGDAEDAVLEVISDAESRYPIDPSSRAIGGFSMGGYGAMSIALNHPGMFAAVGVLSGPLAFWGTMPDTGIYKGIEELLPALLAETGYDTSGGGDLAAYQAAMYPSPERRVTSMMFAMAAAFSPTDPANPGVTTIPDYGVDLPVGLDGNLYMPTWNRWLAHDCLTRFATGQAVNLAGVKVFLNAGLQDDLGLYGAHQVFAGALALAGMPADVDGYYGAVDDAFGDIPAGHVQQTYERLKKLLVWVDGQL